MLRAVLFDLDGTLIDSEKIYHRIEMEIASELGYDFFRPQDALDMRSLYRAASIELMAGRYGDAFDYDKYHDLMTTRFMAEASRCGIELKPGIDEVLGYLKDRGLIAAVVTATALERATKVMSDVGLTGRFDDVISAHEVKKGKPNPDPYLYACDKLGITPEEALCIEDSPNGVLSGVAAGIRTVMIPDLTEPDDELRGVLFDCVPSLADLPKVIEGILQ